MIKLISKIKHALGIEISSLKTIIINGIPSLIMQGPGGLGDDLLLTAVAYELRRRFSDIKIWQVTKSAELLKGNDSYHRTFDSNHWQILYSFLLKSRRIGFSYTNVKTPCVEDVSPEKHIIAGLCESASIKGKINLRPYVYLSEDEKSLGRIANNQVTIRCISENQIDSLMKNKVWGHSNFQKTVNLVKEKYDNEINFIQLGGADDPLLDNVIDLRGKTSLRQTAAILSQSNCCITTVGLMMHLARAVDCRSVVIYGGREHSWQSGYICNENINSYPDCSPCWKWNDCEYDRKCLTSIKPEDVIDAFERVRARLSTPLEIEEFILT